MINKELYEMIFKRKSFHLFPKNNEKISEQEIEIIKEEFKKLNHLISEIKVEIQIVPSDKTTCKRGQEYCILFYSEIKENYLQNIGYIGEQLDLFLTSLNIGTLWFGIGKIEEKTYKGLDFVIMMAIKKVKKEDFRKDMFKSKRKQVNEIWNGESYLDIANIVRFAPSACNTQPWIVESNEKELNVYRYKKPGKRGIMPTNLVTYYNKIDIGIFMLFLELCLTNNNINYKRELYVDNKDEEKVLTTKYTIE